MMKVKPRTFAELGKLLQQRWPDRDASSLAYSIRYLVPIVQVPPRGIWGKSAQPTSTSTELWLRRPLAAKPSMNKPVLRDLTTFWPPTAPDVPAWPALPALRDTPA